MKIAYFSRTQIPSAAANTIQSMEMCAAFAKLDHSVTFFVLSEVASDSDEAKNTIFSQYDLEKIFELFIIKIPATKGSRLRFVWSSLVAMIKIRQALRRQRFDLIYSRDVMACWAGAMAGIDSAFESHFPVWFSRLERFVFNRLLESPKFTELVIISEALQIDYQRRYGSSLTRSLVAPDGACAPEAATKPLRLRGIRGALKVGYVGHLYKGKGLEVISKLAARVSDVEFHVVGGTPEAVRYWEQQSSDNVFFYGLVARSELAGYYQAIDVCVLPNQPYIEAAGAHLAKRVPNISKYTSPLKMFEYMAHKKAIIASDLPVLREILDDTTAILVPPTDTDSWQRAIDRFRVKETRENYGHKAYQEFCSKYSWNQRANKILSSIV